MATALFAWELGGGLGHILTILPLAKHLSACGHRVFVAAKDVTAAHRALGESAVVLPAPTRTRNVSPAYATPLSFAHVLHNIGFGDGEFLAAATAVWGEIFRLTKPDLIVFDHSPLALLASRGGTARRVVIGTGYCVPPDVYPWPSLGGEN